MLVAHKNIPTFDIPSRTWTTTSFADQKAFSNYLDTIFHEPGLYEFDEGVKWWNMQARNFVKNKSNYTMHPIDSDEYEEYWKFERTKCRRGVIFRHANGKEYYLTRDYYFLLNFLVIINKERNNTEGFCDVRDVQYHIALYEKRAEAQHKHAIITKKRQVMSSFYHTAKMLNVYWFEKRALLRNLAGDESYLTGEKGIWNYYNGYRDWLNEHTPWVRNNDPNRDLSWQQRIKYTLDDGREIYKGRKSIITGTTLKKSPTAGVGGPAYYNYFEEAGTFNKLDKTYIYMKPQLESGMFTTGMFIAAGSVGELKDCGPLKRYMYDPEDNGFLGVMNTVVCRDCVPKLTGLFIPEQWGMPPFIDKYGNSLVEEALEYLDNKYKNMEDNAGVSTEDYQLAMSQRPRFLDEAFDHREVSRFPVKRIDKRLQWLKENPAKEFHVELHEDENGEVKWETCYREDISHPVDKKAQDKRGTVIIRKFPDGKPPINMFFGGCDTIEAGITTTSDSLFSIYILEGVTHIRYTDDDGNDKVRIEGGKIMASWTGRYDDLDETNNQGELLIRMYNARTLVERNKSNFINHMKRRRYGHLLLSERDVPFYKDVDFSKDLSNEPGIYMDSTGKKRRELEDIVLENINREINAVFKKDADGNNTDEKYKVYRGLDMIEDVWLLTEMKKAGRDDNTDRFDAYSMANAVCTVFAREGIKKVRDERDDEKKKKPKEEAPRTINYLSNNNYTKRNKFSFIKWQSQKANRK